MSPSPLSQTDYLAREQQIMDATLVLLEDMDVSQLTMDKVVKAVPFSKGTVYSHFSSKEDLLCALNNYAMRCIVKLFKRASQAKGDSRNKLSLLSFAYLIYAMHMPTLFRTCLCAKSPTVMEKASPERNELHEQLEQQLMSVWFQVIDDGINEGNLSMPSTMSKQQICFTMWSAAYGVIMLLSDEIENCSGRRGMILEREYLNSLNLVLDGLNWKPLSSDFEYQQLSRDMETLFADELADIRARGRPILI